jgi:multiple sugar transport system ATP-binding protein
MLFQNIALYPHMTVRDNMAYGLRIDGYSKEDRYRRVEEAAELLQIPDQLNKYPADLSGGQQQRVALGRSLVRDPEVFLFDEPMSDLDAKLTRELRPVIKRVTERIDCPVLYVTHDQEEAMTLSDRIAVMNGGRIEQVGMPEAVYEDPASEFVGSFIGSPTTETFDGRVAERNGSVVVAVGDAYRVATDLDTDRVREYLDGRVRIGIRPQDIRVRGAENGGLPATHQFDELLGDRYNSYFETPLGEVIAVTDSSIDGGEYALSFDPAELKLFDPETGARIV